MSIAILKQVSRTSQMKQNNTPSAHRVSMPQISENCKYVNLHCKKDFSEMMNNLTIGRLSWYIYVVKTCLQEIMSEEVGQNHIEVAVTMKPERAKAWTAVWKTEESASGKSSELKGSLSQQNMARKGMLSQSSQQCIHVLNLELKPNKFILIQEVLWNLL